MRGKHAEQRGAHAYTHAHTRMHAQCRTARRRGGRDTHAQTRASNTSIVYAAGIFTCFSGPSSSLRNTTSFVPETPTHRHRTAETDTDTDTDTNARTRSALMCTHSAAKPHVSSARNVASSYRRCTSLLEWERMTYPRPACNRTAGRVTAQRTPLDGATTSRTAGVHGDERTTLSAPPDTRQSRRPRQQGVTPWARTDKTGCAERAADDTHLAGSPTQRARRTPARPPQQRQRPGATPPTCGPKEGP
jgi:hypothetical protein